MLELNACVNMLELGSEVSVVVFFVCLFVLFLFFETGFLCVALAVLEHTL